MTLVHSDYESDDESDYGPSDSEIDNISQSWVFTSRSTARVKLGQVLSIATCVTRTHRGDSL